MGVGGGGEGWLAPPARTPMLFSYDHPSRTTGTTETTMATWLYTKNGNRQSLTQAFLQVAQQAISLIKPLLHFEAFR